MLPLTIPAWTERVEQHVALVGPFVDAFLQRRGLGQKHPVHDFLFTYYTLSPLKLKQWVPSLQEQLHLPHESLLESYLWLDVAWFSRKEAYLALDPQRIPESTRKLAEFIATLCDNILHKPPRYGCFGLHEWAMVYKLNRDEVRHQEQVLRLSSPDLARFVESQTLCCSHYDAYRFFTQEARPLNTLTPLIETRLEMEQGGCVHANMDIYKWAAKLWPWIGSDFLAKAFLLALEGRELDMRASPYDLREIGYEPICIETEEGRKQYQQQQQLFAERATVLRKELATFCKLLIGYC